MPPEVRLPFLPLVPELLAQRSPPSYSGFQWLEGQALCDPDSGHGADLLRAEALVCSTISGLRGGARHRRSFMPPQLLIDDTVWKF